MPDQVSYQDSSKRRRDRPLDVTCLVLLDASGAVLATRRPQEKQLGGLWEFPGGKVEPGEDPEAALRREILEELALRVGPVQPMDPVVHGYPFGTIRLLPFLHCGARPTSIRLLEHSEYRWVTPRTWLELEWAPADLPVLSQIPAHLGSEHS